MVGLVASTILLVALFGLPLYFLSGSWDDHTKEMVFLIIVGIIGIRADVFLVEMDKKLNLVLSYYATHEVVRKVIPTRSKPVRMAHKVKGS